MSKQIENTKVGPKGGGMRPELKTVRIDNPTNREERRAAKKAQRRGTAAIPADGRRPC